MTNKERLKSRIPKATDAELEDVLMSAEDVILSRCFTSVEHTSEEDKVFALALHNEKLLNAAVIIYNIRGVEGETAHSENGISRTYADNAGLAPILSAITPRCDVI